MVLEIFVSNLFLLPILRFYKHCVSVCYVKSADYQEENYDGYSPYVSLVVATPFVLMKLSRNNMRPLK